jgi:outer membrane receptor protein involved in Fe transport
VQGWLELGEIFAGSSMFSDVKLTLGVLNLFDKEPPFALAGLSAGYDISQANLKQRFGYLRLSKSF